MEPPAKRRRMSQWMLDKENVDEDDDELAFQPFEVEAKRDPDYKLSVERAYADQRFQATMAHIFDKYGRDFEGIGDEIDLVTGEIVVNNGHIRNMRDEGDVGDGLGHDLGDGEDDEDEGILLEDLFDDEEEYGDEDTEERRSDIEVFGGKARDDNNTEEEEEDRIIQGREAPLTAHSTALVLGSSSGNAQSVSRPLLRTSPYTTHKSSPLLLEPPTELPFASSPLSFDRSPFAMEPWSFPGQYTDPLWNQPDLFAAHQPQKQQLPIKASRYDFPAQSGQSSIWAPRSKFRDNEDEPLRSAFTATFGRHLLAKRKKVIRHALLLPSIKPTESDNKEIGEGDEEEDEDVILTGRKSREIKGSDPTLMRPAKDRDDIQQSSSLSPLLGKEPEERAWEGTSSDSGYKSVQSARKGRKRKQRPDEASRAISFPQQLIAPHEKPLLDDQPDEADGRRRPGRMRKQVDFLNKISWADALAELRVEKQLIGLPATGSRNSLGSGHVEINRGLEPVSKYDKRPALVELEDDYIPDSADDEDDDEDNSNSAIDLSISHEKEVGRPNASGQHRAQLSGSFPHKNADSSCLLSDDEAPTLLSKPRKSISSKTAKSILPLREIHNVKTQKGAKASSPDAVKAKWSKSHRNTNNKYAAQDTSPITDKSAIKSGGYVDIFTEGYSSVAPLSSSPTSFLSRFTLQASLDDRPQTSEDSAKKARHQPAAIPSSSPCRRSEDTPQATAPTQKRRQSKKPVSPGVEQLTAAVTQSKQPAKYTAGLTVIDDSSYETSDELPHMESSPLVKAHLHVEPTLPSPRRTASPPEAETRTTSQSPSKISSKCPTKSPLKRTSSALPSQSTSVNQVTSLPSLSNPPQTPRHSNRHSLKAPSSRRSILSLLSDDEDEEVDELGRNLAAMPKLLSSATRSTARKVWKSSSRTREVYHTPVKKRPSEPISPGSIIKTPGEVVLGLGERKVFMGS
ncbi:hypothetical protein TARUN_5487 [Trichoderma arundinaceum]|uniref:Uncharacterized protein n=1 Tax=Trichoderma arundinaceum TaxID=490622 RepID=A0A395NL30_TRIAR|nr:hypothetical protein TARUN_5487 [Trichoderma arundinaceum]